MAKNTANPVAFADMIFPTFGLNISLEFDRQVRGTTPLGTNVRALDPGTLRMRGAARPGLSKYIADDTDPGDGRVAGVRALVQHLAIVVDPTVDGLISDDDDGPITDPSTSNRRRRIPVGATRKLRNGGSGKQTNRRQPRPKLLITASDQTKVVGDTFTFSGDEFTASGLRGIDSADNAIIRSTGSAASAVDGTYPIRISSIQGTVAEGGLLRTKYKVVYVQGTMTVGGVRYCMACSFGFFNGTEVEFSADLVFDGVATGSYTHNTSDDSEYQTFSDSTGRPSSLDPIPPVNDLGNVAGSGIGINVGPGHHLIEVTVNSDFTGAESGIGSVIFAKMDSDGNVTDTWGIFSMTIDSTINVFNSDFTAT